jgi:protein tyrosine phosphatase
VPLKNGTYINANFAFNEEYIQTQTPIPETIAHFWQMVDEYGVKTIVMLNEPHEYRVMPYWPEFNKHLSLSELTFQLKNVEEVVVPRQKMGKIPAIIVRREIKMLKGEKEHFVTHFHYTNWKDNQAPDQNGMLKLIELVDKAQGTSKAPIVVHCSAGIGRTGVFTLIHRMTKEMKKEGYPNSLSLALTRMRSPLTGRSPYMVASQQQYLFCYKFLDALYTHKIPASDKPKTLKGRITNILTHFQAGNQIQALALFAKVPQEIRNEVYKGMYEKLGSPPDTPLNHGENCFHDLRVDVGMKIPLIENLRDQTL